MPKDEALGAMQAVVNTLATRLRALETAERAELAGSVEVVVFISLPAAGQPGRVRFVSDGRKLGEGVGLGTGVIVYDDSVAWRRSSDDTTVAV